MLPVEFRHYGGSAAGGASKTYAEERPRKCGTPNTPVGVIPRKEFMGGAVLSIASGPKTLL